VHLLVQLSLADLLAAIVLMCTSVINKVHPFSAVVCPYLLPLSLTFYFISFLLAIVYALKSRNAMQGWRDRAADEEDEHVRQNKTFILIYMILHNVERFSHFMPLSMSVLACRVSVGEKSKRFLCMSYCILFLHVWKDPCVGVDKIHDTFIRVFLAIVVITAMLSCSVSNQHSDYWHEQYMQVGLFPVEGDGHLRRQLKRVFSTARNIVMVILFCWAPGTLTHVQLKLTIIYSLYGLYLIQAATVSLQGFLNSMVYAWRRPNFTEAVLGEITPLLRYKQKTPYFEESFHC
uniref:Si:dkey-30c15.2 n=1 Tax=Poecilia latipinna TaxID=48699 RepID=A0A3B3UG30_9TELE